MNNKPIYLLMIAAASAFTLASCKDDTKTDMGSISLSINEQTVEAASGSFTVDVTSNADFTVNTPNWISVDPDQDSYQSGTLTFNYEENTGTVSRSGNIIFRCLDARDTLVVTQAAGEDLYHDEFMQNTEPGLYGANFDSFSYQEFTNQYAVRSYANGLSYDYKLISIDPNLFFTARSIPVNLEAGSTASIGLQQNVTPELNSNFFETYVVEKIDGNKIWLYNSLNRFGIIITKE